MPASFLDEANLASNLVLYIGICLVLFILFLYWVWNIAKASSGLPPHTKSLDNPVLILGPSLSGKSTLFEALKGESSWKAVHARTILETACQEAVIRVECGFGEEDGCWVVDCGSSEEAQEEADAVIEDEEGIRAVLFVLDGGADWSIDDIRYLFFA